ncbi:MAG: response regulator [Rhodobacteraceae bacterium]|nr:response regulator [Paracoccaceae bacterium]
MEAFGQLAGGVAHDFNNLMAVIMGNIELLQEENDPFVRSELTGAALDAVLRGKDLTGSLLNFARKAPLRPRHILLKEMFANLEKIIHRTLPAHQDVVFDIPDTLWPIEADPSMLESCILNLVLNARDAMPNGGILKISARQINCRNAATQEHKDLRPGVYVVIEVSDTGEGIAEKDLPRVFEPFFTTKPVGKGSGLGLARVRGFAKQSGGDVQIKSKASRGTSIKMALPASVMDVNPTERSGQKSDTSMARILLVEDMEDVRKVMERRLKADGYEVVSARLGDEALEIFHHDKNFDVMITDIVMPGKLQGAELALKIKAAKPEIGIIHMSGYTRGGLENLGIATSEILLKKPVAKSDLYAALNQVLNRRNF